MKNGFHNWSDVRIFLAVVREGSTLAASRKLGVAQPTVARRIEALETVIGVTLFERDTRGFKPTQDARSLIPLAENIERAATDFAEKSHELTRLRPIRITAYSGNFSPRMTEIVNEFAAKNPGITFEFLPSVKVLDLAAGEADIALRITRHETNPDLICRKISTARWALFGGHSYAEKFGLPTSLDSLKGHKFVNFKRDDVSNDMDTWLMQHVSPDQIVMSFSELDLMHAAIRSGLGLGITNIKLVEKDETLIRCFDEIEELTAPHLLLVAPEAYRRPEVKAFTKFFAPRYAAIFQ